MPTSLAPISPPANGDGFVPPRTADTPTKVYKGSCHCKKFQFECRHPVIEDGFEVIKCNCSICTQRGYLMMYVLYLTNPAEELTILEGALADLTCYKFASKIATHMFCPICGSAPLSEINFSSQKLMAVNVRTLEYPELDLNKLTLKHIDMRLGSM
ncbi:hypothetical protein K439DRAFT_1410357 [Ramaria rubella]|nr:hypothetical protein K439DRAFT_1410357 [Ramaria rubella]